MVGFWREKKERFCEGEREKKEWRAILFWCRASSLDEPNVLHRMLDFRKSGLK